MHNLKPVTALGGATAAVDIIGSVTITENPNVALASITARHGKEAACHKGIKSVLGDVPQVSRAVLRDPEAGFWMGPDQWMLGAPLDSHELLADDLKAKLGDAASVTEQSGAWVVFDVTGDGMVDMMERLCAAPVRRMGSGDVQRTVIHQLGCFVIRRVDADHVRILGPRASAGTLHHALVTAAKSVA